MEMFEGIIIAKNKYRDNSFILTILNQAGTISAKLLNTKSNRFNDAKYQIFNTVKVEMYKGPNKFYSIKDGVILRNIYYEKEDDFLFLGCIEFIKELYLKNIETYQDITYFKLLDITLSNMLTNGSLIKTLTFFMAYLLKISGIFPTIDMLHEVMKKLNCKEENNENKSCILTAEATQLINDFNKKRYNENYSESINKTTLVEILKCLIFFYEYYYNEKIVSKSLIFSIIDN